MHVTSVVKHGFEGWHLSYKAQAMINGFDIRFRAIITGFDCEIARHNRVFNLLAYVRLRRFTFLGLTLRLPPENLAFQTLYLAAYHTFLTEQPHSTRALEGTIFMDSPSPLDFDMLVSTASVRQDWRALGEAIRVTGGRQRGLRGSRRSGRLIARTSKQPEAHVK